MLESEWERVRTLHPDLHETWMDFLVDWAGRKGWIGRRSLPVHGGGGGLHPRCAGDSMGGIGRIVPPVEIQYLSPFSNE